MTGREVDGTADAGVQPLEASSSRSDRAGVAPTDRDTAASAAEELRRFAAAGNPDAALRVAFQLAADLDRADPALRVARCAMPPAPTGDRRLDALLAGVVDHALSTAGLPLPAWVSDDACRLDQPWDVEPVPSLRDAARGRTPDAFRRHGVFLDPVELRNS